MVCILIRKIKVGPLCVLLLALMTSTSLISQEGPPRISLSFDRISTKEVLNQLEEASGMRFYYLEDWFEDKLHSGNYLDQALETILEDLFGNSTINFFVLDKNSVILSRNNVIYEKISEAFYVKDTVLNDPRPQEIIASRTSRPQFYTTRPRSEDQSIVDVKIGKETKTQKNAEFSLLGRVFDEKSGEAVPQAALVIADLNTGTSTDNSGNYGLKLAPGSHLLEVSALGFEKKRFRVIMYNDGVLNITLLESVEQLDEVVLSGEANRNVEEPLLGVTQIKVEEIKTIPLVLGERDLFKAAITLPGITNAGEGAAGYNVRGGRTDQNLILLDNGVIYNPAHFFGLFSAINPFTTSTINIYKGSIPAQYGGRLSSVFDIQTKNANTGQFAGEGSIGPVTGNLMLEGPIVKDKAGILVGARASYSDWILRSLDNESLKNSQASFFDLMAKYNHQINERNDLAATAYYSDDAFSITSDSLFKFNNRLLTLKWNHQFNKKNTLSLGLYNSNYDFNIEFEGDADRNFDLNYRIDETALRLQLKYLHNVKTTLNYGLVSKLYSVNPGSITPTGASIVSPLEIPKERGLESAAYASLDFDISKKLSLSTGFRYSLFAALGPSIQRIYTEGLPRNATTLAETRDFESNEVIKTYNGLESRLSARYFILPDFSIKAGYNTTYQYVHTLSNNTTASPTDTWKLTDANIRPQQAIQYSVGLYKNFEDNMYELSLEGYYKDTEDILDYKVGAQLLLNETVETEIIQGKGRAYGLEVLLKKNRGKLNGWLGYTYSRAELRFDGNFLEERINNGNFFPANFDKPHDISLVANYKMTKRFSFSTNFSYQTGRPITFPAGNVTFGSSDFVFFSNRNAFRIPDYYRLDLSFNVEGNHKIKKLAHSFWNFSIYNVLGRNNPYSVFFITENGEVKALKNSIFAIPIPTITYNFKF